MNKKTFFSMTAAAVALTTINPEATANPIDQTTFSGTNILVQTNQNGSADINVDGKNTHVTQVDWTKFNLDASQEIKIYSNPTDNPLNRVTTGQVAGGITMSGGSTGTINVTGTQQLNTGTTITKTSITNVQISNFKVAQNLDDSEGGWTFIQENGINILAQGTTNSAVALLYDPIAGDVNLYYGDKDANGNPGFITTTNTSVFSAPNSFNITQSDTQTVKDMNTLAVPEPSSLSMLAGSFGLALGLQRFRRNRARDGK